MIKIPTHTDWTGEGRKPIAGAMERLLKESQTPFQPKPSPIKYQKSQSGFIYIPAIDKSVTDHRVLLGKNYDDSQGEIVNTTENGQKLSIITPYEFREFLKYLRDSKDSKDKGLFRDITEVKDPYRANWLNARFEKRKGGLFMISENVLENGNYKTTEQKLDDFLNKDRQPGISLDGWLDSDAPHGLPKAKSEKGDLWYWYPREGAVARFIAYSVRAYLDCNWGPAYSNSSLGVFACAEGAVAKNLGVK